MESEPTNISLEQHLGDFEKGTYVMNWQEEVREDTTIAEEEYTSQIFLNNRLDGGREGLLVDTGSVENVLSDTWLGQMSQLYTMGGGPTGPMPVEHTPLSKPC